MADYTLVAPDDPRYRTVAPGGLPIPPAPPERPAASSYRMVPPAAQSAPSASAAPAKGTSEESIWARLMEGGKTAVLGLVPEWLGGTGKPFMEQLKTAEQQPNRTFGERVAGPEGSLALGFAGAPGSERAKAAIEPPAAKGAGNVSHETIPEEPRGSATAGGQARPQPAPAAPASPVAPEAAPRAAEAAATARPPADIPIPPAGIADDLRRIFTPAARGEAADKTAGMMREGLARREQEFQTAAENLRGYGREVGKLPPAAKLDFMDAIETGQLERYKGTPLYKLGGEIRALFDDRWKKMERLGIAPAYVQDYLPHLWQDPGAAAKEFIKYYGKSSLEGGKKFTKERTFSTIKAGMGAGLKPVTDNPIELSLLQLHQMDKYITAQDIIGEMEHEGLARRIPHDERSPPGWIAINDKIARKGNATLYAPEPAATIVNRALSPGLSGMPAYDAVRSVGNMMNSAQLGLSGFHAAFVTADAMTSAIAKGLKQISRGEPGEIARGFGNILRAPSAPVTNYLRGRQTLRRYLGLGEYGQDMDEIVRSLIAGGGRAKMDAFYRGNTAAGSFWQAMRGSLVRSSGRQTLTQDLRQMYEDAAPIKVKGYTVVPGVVKVTAQLVPRIMDTMMAPIMEDLVPKMKLGVFYDLMKDELRRNPGMDKIRRREIAGRIWDSVDNRLGQLAYDNLFWNKTMKDLGHIGVRALGWNLGTLREIAGGAANLRKRRGVESGEGRQILENTSYALAAPIATAMMGSIYMYLKTGKGPQDYKDYFFPKTGGFDANGNPERVSMPGYFKDAYEWSTQPGQTAINKIHPLWPALYGMMNNQDWNGAAIADTTSGVGLPQVKDYGIYMLRQFMPMSVRPQPGTDQANIGALEQWFGVRPAPYRARDPDEAEDWATKDAAKKVKKGERSGVEYSQ